MITDIIDESGVEVIFSYSPAWEMFFSMHVLSGPDHHVSRRKWRQSVEKKNPELAERVRNLQDITIGWTLFIDIPVWDELRQGRRKASADSRRLRHVRRSRSYGHRNRAAIWRVCRHLSRRLILRRTSGRRCSRFAAGIPVLSVWPRGLPTLCSRQFVYRHSPFQIRKRLPSSR